MLQTHWEFEERLRRSAVLEDVAAASHRAVRLAARERSSASASHPDRATTEAGPSTQVTPHCTCLPHTMRVSPSVNVAPTHFRLYSCP